MNFIKDVLNRNNSLKFVSTKYGIAEEDIMTEYLKHKQQYTQAEIDKVMNEVYYNAKN